jgi:RNase H-like domain found in reverse transcriptase
VPLEGRWTSTCEKAFRGLQEDILTLMTTAHPDPSKRVCVFTDASDTFYSGMINQVPEHHLDLPVGVHLWKIQRLTGTLDHHCEESFRCHRDSDKA